MELERETEMAGSNSQKELLTLIRDVSTEKSQGGILTILYCTASILHIIIQFSR